jgi:hypothetical protein
LDRRFLDVRCHTIESKKNDSIHEIVETNQITHKISPNVCGVGVRKFCRVRRKMREGIELSDRLGRLWSLASYFILETLYLGLSAISNITCLYLCCDNIQFLNCFAFFQKIGLSFLSSLNSHLLTSL